MNKHGKNLLETAFNNVLIPIFSINKGIAHEGFALNRNIQLDFENMGYDKTIYSNRTTSKKSIINIIKKPIEKDYNFTYVVEGDFHKKTEKTNQFYVLNIEERANKIINDANALKYINSPEFKLNYLKHLHIIYNSNSALILEENGNYKVIKFESYSEFYKRMVFEHKIIEQSIVGVHAYKCHTLNNSLIESGIKNVIHKEQNTLFLKKDLKFEKLLETKLILNNDDKILDNSENSTD